ncbi:MAG: CheR family methyltransferase [Myxococcota bacterium]
MALWESSQPESGALDADPAFEALRNIVWARLGLDLSHYKRACVLRRLEVRLRACGCPNLKAYLEQVATDGDEVQAFLSTLTVNVTEFFRNPPCFEQIRARCLPKLFPGRNDDDAEEQPLRRRQGPLRVWCVGCASGEESYSIAILLREYLDDHPHSRPRSFEVRGSDIDAAMITRANLGCFEADRLTGVSRERRERWFDNEGEGWRVKRRVRACVRHEVADVLRHAPEEPHDMIVCRNMMIYLAREPQETLLQRFREVLAPGGFLVLGRTELLTQNAREHFETVCPRERIYRLRA